MNGTSVRLRRLILGMSVEDAQSKFDSPQSRSMLRVAHERHNQGILHELQIAQQQRNRMPPEKKCHISRYTKPSVKGFQSYVKQTPDDYVIVELWPDTEQQSAQAQEEKRRSDGNAGGGGGPRQQQQQQQQQSTTAAVSAAVATTAPLPAVIRPKVAQEKALFSRNKETVLETLRDALDNVKNNVLVELTERRQSGALVAGQQPSVMDRLVGELSESGGGRGYKSLSSSTHLLEPVEMELTLYAKKDKDIAAAFRSPLLSFPAREGDISYSLWVAGGLIANDEIIGEFPFHVAKYVVAEDHHGPNRLPRVDIEVYFSAELHQLQRTIGRDGVTALRKFIGTTMMHQHEPAPVSPTILLNSSQAELELLNLYDPGKTESIRIPWIRKTRSVVSTLTGVALSVEDAVAESATMENMKEGMGLAWRAWGHLIKDLHIHGDLDYLYVSIDRNKEVRENSEYIGEVQLTERDEAARRDQEVMAITDGRPKVAGQSTRKGGGALALAAAAAAAAARRPAFFCPIAADFTVIEVLLERKGLPHNMVMEDITETLTEMQAQSMEMLRLAAVESNGPQDDDEESGGGGANIIPVLYAPKVVVTHAGVIENRTHSFQRVRIRGSTLAHVEALVATLADEDYFTSRGGGGGSGDASSRSAAGSDPATTTTTTATTTTTLALPKNLTFSATHEEQTASLLRQSQRALGHRAEVADLSQQRRGGNGRFRRHQTAQSLDFMSVSDDERSFWRENYYRLSTPRVLFQDRVGPTELGLGDGGAPGKPVRPSARLLEHLNLVGTKITAGGEDDTDEAAAAEDSSNNVGGGKGKKASARRRKQKKRPLDVSQIPRERMFEYLCTDVEAESSGYDLRVGDCLGYSYRVNLRQIQSKQVDLVAPAVHSVAAKGFINYFGPNRFASYTKMNMHPGLHLLRGEFRAAAHVIVQQFYLDASVAAEKKRTGAAFPQPMGVNSTAVVAFHLSDLSRGSGGGGGGGGLARRSVAESGTALQRVLSNALQATLLMAGAGPGDDDDTGLFLPGGGGGGQNNRSAAAALATHTDHRGTPSFLEMVGGDPCADAFLNVIGPNACHILIHEFLSFLWNDIVNQRLQRYGTFAILPGDLVRKNPLTPRGSAAFGELTRATRREVAQGTRTHWDVVLPIPGANMELPDNHTADLYIVTLKRMGLTFDPEARQWQCFYPKRWEEDMTTAGGRHGCGGGGMSGSNSVPLTSPYRYLSSSYQLMEEELGFQTPFTEPLPRHLSSPSSPSSSSPQASTADNGLSEEQQQRQQVLYDPESDGLAAALAGTGGVFGPDSLFDAGGLRPDLQRQRGNPLNLLVEAGYRHPLYNPGPNLQWRFTTGAEVSDPHQRWGVRQLRGWGGGGGGAEAEPRKLLAAGLPAKPSPVSSTSTSSSSSSRPRPTTAGLLPVGTYLPAASADEMPRLVLPSLVGSGDSDSSESRMERRPDAISAMGESRGAPTSFFRAVHRQQQRQQQQERRDGGDGKKTHNRNNRSLSSNNDSPLDLPAMPSRWRGRRLPIPKTPYWLPTHNDACLTLDVQLPTGTYAAMLLRELTKLDVNAPDMVDIDRPLVDSSRQRAAASSFSSLTTDQQELHRRYLARRRQRSFVPERPQAVSLALLHQQIFRSGGTRGALIPSLRSYDSVSK